MLEAALRSAYPNCRLTQLGGQPRSTPAALLRLKKDGEFIRRVKVAGSLRARARAADQQVADRDGRSRSDVLVQLAIVPRRCCSSASPAVCSSSREARCRASGAPICSCATARWSRTPSCAAAWMSSTRRCSSPTSACRSAIAATCERSPRSCAPKAPRTGSSSAARRFATECSRCTGGVSQRGEGNPLPPVHSRRVRPERAGVALASAVDRLRDRAVRARRAAARAGAAGDPAPARWGGLRNAARRARPGLDPRRAAQAEHGGAGRGRAGQVQLSDRDRRRGSAARALCGDRAGPEGRRGGCRREPRSAGAHVHGAGLRPSDMRLQSARGRRAGRRDRRLRRRGAEEPVQRRRHTRFVGPLPAQRDHRRARLRSLLDAVGCGAAAVGRRGGLRLSARSRCARAGRCPSTRRYPRSSPPS